MTTEAALPLEGRRSDLPGRGQVGAEEHVHIAREQALGRVGAAPPRRVMSGRVRLLALSDEGTVRTKRGKNGRVVLRDGEDVSGAGEVLGDPARRGMAALLYGRDQLVAGDGGDSSTISSACNTRCSCSSL